MLEMANARLYGFWGSLTEALRTGAPPNKAKRGENFFEALYADPARLAQFARAMSAVSGGVAQAIAAKFPWRDHGSVIDVGCAEGAVPVQIALAHDHNTGGGFDLPPIEPIFEANVARVGLGERLRFTAGGFFADPLPEADVLVMGHILHDWNIDEKRLLLQKAYDALPESDALIVYEAIIDDERRNNAFGLLMSLNMLIETPGGFDYTGADCRTWMQERVSAKVTSSTWSGQTQWSSGSSRRSCPSRWRFSDIGVTPASRRQAYSLHDSCVVARDESGPATSETRGGFVLPVSPGPLSRGTAVVPMDS